MCELYYSSSLKAKQVTKKKEKKQEKKTQNKSIIEKGVLRFIQKNNL